jgi:molybdate transport system substrate-binding protein
MLLQFAMSCAIARGAESITVSAAVSLKEVLTDVADAYASDGKAKPELNFGATGQLLAQIREGAPVDLFIAASQQRMAQATSQGLVDRASARVIAENRLVLIVPADSKLKIDSFKDLPQAGVKRLAIGQPKTVPAGDYAMQVLEHLKIETALKDAIVYGSSVRQVLDYVERGEVDAGVVYATDAAQSGDKVRVIASAETSWHRPIEYVAAIVQKSARRSEAEEFMNFLQNEKAAALLTKRGFICPASPPTHP